MSNTPSVSLFERLGGEAAVNAAVDRFYQKVLQDSLLSPFFEGVPMSQQIAKQKAFLTMVFGGPSAYSGKDLRSAHTRLVAMGMDDSHFDKVVDHLGSTLQELGVATEQIKEVAAIAESVRKDVLNR